MSMKYSSSTTNDWVNINGKPYITVSSKGISNKLSTKPNDGADFGPDTTLGATSPSQIGPPYTQTYRIQEAINYVFAQNGGKIVIKNGIYDLTNASFQPWLEGTASGCKILIPENDISTNDIIPIEIVGESSVWPNSELVSGTFSNPPDFGVVIRSLDNASTLGITGNNYVILSTYYPATSNIPVNGVDILLDQISFVTLAGTGIGGVNLEGASSMTVPNLVIGVNSSFPLPEPSSSVGAYGFQGNAHETNKNCIGNLYVYGYYYGISIGSHTNIGRLSAIGNYWVLQLLSVTHGSQIDFMVAEWNTNIFVIPNQGSVSSLNLHVTKIVVSDNQDPSGMSWANASSYVKYGGSYTSPIITIDIWEQPYAQLTSLQAGIFVPGGGVVHIKNVFPSSFAATSISANPPVSGTVYLNGNPYDIRLKIPVTYNPTTTAAATLATGISPTSTVTTTTKVSIPAGLTAADGEILTYEMVVPAGWYYELVATNATIGTAEVQAE